MAWSLGGLPTAAILTVGDELSKIISFSWTMDALLAGRKTCTRRDWDADYARRFKANDVCQAWDHQPRTRKGRKWADIRLTVEPYWEPLRDMPDEDYEAEGFKFYEENPHLLPPDAPFTAMPFDQFDVWRLQPGSMWVVRFQLEDIVEGVLSEVLHHD
jgi:hypothetical protein